MEYSHFTMLLVSALQRRESAVCIHVCTCMLSCFSCVQLSVNLWATARQAPMPMGFSRQEYWSRLPCPPPGDLPDSGTEHMSLMSPVLAGRFPTNSAAWEAHTYNKFPLYCIPSHSEHSVEFPVLKVKVAQSCPTLCDPVDYTVHEILQARIPEWAAVSSYKGSSQPRDRTQVSRITGRFFTS